MTHYANAISISLISPATAQLLPTSESGGTKEIRLVGWKRASGRGEVQRQSVSVECCLVAEPEIMRERVGGRIGNQSDMIG